MSWSNGFCSGRGERGSLVANGRVPWHRNTILIHKYITPKKIWPNISHSYKDKREEEGEKVKHIQNFQNCPFWTYIFFIENQHMHFWVHGHFSWSTISVHLVRRPKTLRMHLFRNWTMEVCTTTCDHGKMPSDMGQLHGPWCKQPWSSAREVFGHI